MPKRFIKKNVKRVYARPYIKKKEEPVKPVEKAKATPKKIQEENNMNTEALNQAEDILNKLDSQKPKVKVVKKEKGLIEKTETENIIITEDNRRVLTD